MTDIQTDQNAGILETVVDPRVLDPLSEITRRERRNLLLASLLAFAISIGGLVPTEITALGIKLSQTERDAILLLVSLSILYLLAGFCIYSLADLRSRNIAIAMGRKRVSPEIAGEISKSQVRAKEYLKNKNFKLLFEDPETKKLFSVSEELKLAGLAKATGVLRVAFEIYLPVIVSLTAVSFSLYNSRGLLLARITAGVTAFLFLFISFIWCIRKRKGLKAKLKNAKRRWYKWRFDRVMKGFKKKAKDGVDNKKMQEKLLYLMKKSTS